VLLAYVGRTLAGCGALRPLADVTTQRLRDEAAVRAAGFRASASGGCSRQALLDEARGAGYSAMLLDTLDDMERRASCTLTTPRLRGDPAVLLQSDSRRALSEGGLT
jgi:hypothetical protein